MELLKLSFWLKLMKLQYNFIFHTELNAIVFTEVK